MSRPKLVDDARFQALKKVVEENRERLARQRRINYKHLALAVGIARHQGLSRSAVGKCVGIVDRDKLSDLMIHAHSAVVRDNLGEYDVEEEWVWDASL